MSYSYCFVNLKDSVSMSDDLHVKTQKQQWFLQPIVIVLVNAVVFFDHDKGL